MKISPGIGPGTYESNFEPLVRKQPTYSMATRFKIPTDENQKPGPAQHHHERVRKFETGSKVGHL